MEDNKHTKGEWKINPVETAHTDIGIMSPLIKDGEEIKYGFHFERICRVEGNFDYLEAEANGKFICKAVNKYDKLVKERELLIEALESVLNRLDISGNMSCAAKEYYSLSVNKAKELLNNLKK